LFYFSSFFFLEIQVFSLQLIWIMNEFEYEEWGNTERQDDRQQDILSFLQCWWYWNCKLCITNKCDYYIKLLGICI
jgi:hypothetical protein